MAEGRIGRIHSTAIESIRLISIQTLCLPLCLSVYLCVSRSVSVFLSLLLCLSPSRSLSLSVSLFLYTSLAPSVSRLCLCLLVSVSLSLMLSGPFFLTMSLCREILYDFISVAFIRLLSACFTLSICLLVLPFVFFLLFTSSVFPAFDLSSLLSVYLYASVCRPIRVRVSVCLCLHFLSPSPPLSLRISSLTI